MAAGLDSPNTFGNYCSAPKVKAARATEGELRWQIWLGTPEMQMNMSSWVSWRNGSAEIRSAALRYQWHRLAGLSISPKENMFNTYHVFSFLGWITHQLLFLLGRIAPQPARRGDSMGLCTLVFQGPRLAGLPKNMATGWLGALVRVTNLKFWFLRLRELLVFAGVVKKCLPHGHSFRLADVWIKSENLRFACAVSPFCSSREKNIRNPWFQSSESYQGDIPSSICFLFSTLQCPSACGNAEATDCNKAALWRHVQLQAHVYLCLYTCWFFVEHRHRSPFFELFPCSIHLLSTSNNGSIGFTPQTTSNMISLSKDLLFVVDLGHLKPFVGIIFDTTGCKTSGSICSDNARARNPTKARQKACATCQQRQLVP